MTTNSSTQYMRSVNDYSLSAHEIYNDITGEKFPSFTRVTRIPNVNISSFTDAVNVIIQNLADSGFVKVNDGYSVNYDDDRMSDPSPYTIYAQQFFILRKHSSIVVLEAYNRGGELIILTLSTESLHPHLESIRENLAKQYKPQKKEQVFYTISQNSHGFELEEMNIPTVYNEDDVNWHYNDDFLPVHKLIHDSIDNNKKGLILMHGLPGSGKTSYIKQLISKGSMRKIVYVPPHLANSIANPSFISFVRERLKSCVLVIEDAEDILRDRESNTSATAVSNLLNISDGILGDALNILIIATFNMDRQYIDSALLRKDRMLGEYRFGELTVDKANALVKKLYGEDAVLNLAKNDKCTLGNIFNMDVEQPRAKETPKVAFGFQAK